MIGLLVSVRDPIEAAAALAGGAALIDVKEPARGSLGRAEEAAMAAIVRSVAGRRPVSAALGELKDGDALPKCAGLSYVKWGLAESAGRDWRGELTCRLSQTGPQLVIAAYADWECAVAPPVEEVVAFACERPGNVLLVDTHCKDATSISLRRRPTLLDWLGVDDLMEICDRCREARVRVALAGSLGRAEIEALLPVRPDWFAVRGSVCGGGDRGGSIDANQVRSLTRFLETSEAFKTSEVCRPVD